MKRMLALLAAVLLLVPAVAPAQSLEEETRAPRGTNSLDDDSDALQGQPMNGPSDSVDDDSDTLQGQQDQPTDSLDDGSMGGGNQPNPDWPQFPNQ